MDTIWVILIILGAGLLEYVTNLLFSLKIIFVSKSDFERAAIYGSIATFLWISLSTALTFTAISINAWYVILIGAAVIAFFNFLGTITVAYVRNEDKLYNSIKKSYYSFMRIFNAGWLPNIKAKKINFGFVKEPKKKMKSMPEDSYFVTIAAIKKYEAYEARLKSKANPHFTTKAKVKTISNTSLSRKENLDWSLIPFFSKKVAWENKMDKHQRDPVVLYQADKIRHSLNSKEDRIIRSLRLIY